MSRATSPKNNFPAALRKLRKSKGMSQEAFSLISSRTYLSSLERGLQSPTLNKVDSLAENLEVHPLTLLTLSYIKTVDAASLKKVFDTVEKELSAL